MNCFWIVYRKFSAGSFYFSTAKHFEFRDRHHMLTTKLIEQGF